jgi:tetratricopeptide (TPR) repeat protein
VDASLVKAAGDGRFAILETIREFAVDRLEASAEAGEIRRAHAAYFLDLAERSETQLAGPDQGPWMLRLVDDQDNLRDAMAVAVEAGEAELATRFGAALWLFWYRRGDMIEADRWYAVIRPLAERVGDALRARFLYGAAQVPMMRADWPRTRDELEETRRLAAESGETKTLVRALSDLGSTYHFLGDSAASAAAFDEGLAAARSSGDRPRAAMIVGNAGQVALEDGELERAERLLGEALREYGELGDLLGLSSVLHSQGSLQLRRRDVVTAARSFSQGLAAIRSTGMLSTISSFIVASASVALELDDAPSAARLLGAADAIAEHLGFAFWEYEGAAQAAAKARAELGDDAFESVHSEGAKLDFEEALHESERVFADAVGSSQQLASGGGIARWM